MLGFTWGSSAAKKQADAALEEPNEIAIPEHRPLSRSHSNLSHPAQTDESSAKFNHLQCPFCRKLMTTERKPILLDCGHSFCGPCIELMPVFENAQGRCALWRGIRRASANFGYGNSPMMIDQQPAGDVQQRSFVSSLIARLISRSPQIPAGVRTMERIDEGPESDETLNDDKENSDASSCLLGGIQVAGYGHIRCLECREKTNLDRDGLEDMEPNLFLAGAADKAMRKLSICSDCGNSKTKKYCEECGLYLCSPCSKRIHSGMVTSRHNVADLDESVDFPQSIFSPACLQHPKEESVLYCLSCEELACVLCAYGNHKQHDISLLTDAIGNLKHKLRQIAQHTTDTLHNVTCAKQSINAEVSLLKENSVAAKAFICKKIDEIKQLLDGVEKQMCDNVDSEESDKTARLKRQESELDALESDLKLRIQLANSVIKNRNAAEMVEPTNRQLKTLTSVLAEVPSLHLCTSGIIEVRLDNVRDSLMDIHEELVNHQFPRLTIGAQPISVKNTIPLVKDVRFNKRTVSEVDSTMSNDEEFDNGESIEEDDHDDEEDDDISSAPSTVVVSASQPAPSTRTPRLPQAGSRYRAEKENFDAETDAVKPKRKRRTVTTKTSTSTSTASKKHDTIDLTGSNDMPAPAKKAPTITAPAKKEQTARKPNANDFADTDDDLPDLNALWKGGRR